MGVPMHPSPSIAELRSQILAASAALLARLQTDESSLEEAMEDGSRLVVEILHLPAAKDSALVLQLLPDPLR